MISHWQRRPVGDWGTEKFSKLVARTASQGEAVRPEIAVLGVLPRVRAGNIVDRKSHLSWTQRVQSVRGPPDGLEPWLKRARTEEPAGGASGGGPSLATASLVIACSAKLRGRARMGGLPRLPLSH